MSIDLYNEAERLEALGMHDAASDIWRKIIVESPSANAWCRLGRSASYRSAFEESELAFRAAAELAPESPDPWIGLGLVATDRGDALGARDSFQRACELEPRASTYCLLGAAWSELGRDDLAEGAFRHAINIDANYEEAYYNLATTLSPNDPTAAEHLLRKAKSLILSMGLRTVSLADYWCGGVTTLRRSITLVEL